MVAMLEAFETAQLAVRHLTMDDAQELTAISDVAQVSQWMSFMEGGFPLDKARGLTAAQSETKECFFAVRLRNGALAGALGMVDHPDQTIVGGYWFGVDYQGNGYGYEALKGLLEQITTNPLDALYPPSDAFAVVGIRRPEPSREIPLFSCDHVQIHRREQQRRQYDRPPGIKNEAYSSVK